MFSHRISLTLISRWRKRWFTVPNRPQPQVSPHCLLCTAALPPLWYLESLLMELKCYFENEFSKRYVLQSSV